MDKAENLFGFDLWWRILGGLRRTVRKFVTGIDVSGDQGLVEAEMTTTGGCGCGFVPV
jgi:hypothetical protein